MGTNLYLNEIINNPGKPYVYFNSLPSDILNQVAGYFSQDIKEISKSDSGISSIDQAFSFLKAVITTERAKENAFIEYLKNKTQTTLKLEIPNINSDWTNFVKTIQQTIDFGNTGLIELKNEYTRLKENQNNLNKAQEDGRDSAWYAQNALSKTSQQLRNMIKDFKEKTYNSKKTSSIILETIVERYKDNLITIKDNGDLDFNKAELAAMILSVTQMITETYNIYSYTLEKGDPLRRLTKESLNKILDDSQIDEDVNTFLNKFKKIPSFRQDMIKNYNLQGNSKGRKISGKVLLDDTEQIKNDPRAITMEIERILQGYEFPEKAVRLITTTNALAEVDSLLKFAVNGALKTVNTGSKGAKPDNIIGYLSIDPTAAEVFTDSERDRIIHTTDIIIEKMDTLINTLSKANTTEYYQDQAKHWNTFSKEIDELLKSLEDIYGFLPSCFIIEDSTKNYLSLYARMEDGEQANGVHGGSLGANLNDQLNKIDALTSAGGITMIDKQWLTATIINAGPNMIASGQKEKIENYLAMFAAILLFDGQINIAQEAMHYMTEQQLSSGNTHQIHLFSVNGGYYPLSYVLKLTYDSLNEGLQRIQSAELSQGVQVEIYGFVSEPNSNNYTGLSSWEATADAAQKSTKIKMKFLVQFQNIVQNLLQLN